MSMDSRTHAAVLAGRADYRNEAGEPLREHDVTDEYYRSNHGETFPRRVENRVNAGTLKVRPWGKHRSR
jgi:hypothetical protein